MAEYTPIFTDNALNKMKSWGVSEQTAKEVYYKGDTEKSRVPGAMQSIKKYHGYEIGVVWSRKPTGQYVIISVWKRTNRR